MPVRHNRLSVDSYLVGALLLVSGCGTPQSTHTLQSPSGSSPAVLTTVVVTSQPLINTGGFIALGPDENLYVSSGDGPRPHVSKVSPAGALLMQFSGFAGDSGVQGVAIDSHGNVYASDQGSNDVVKFSPDGKLIARIGTSMIGEPGGLTIDKDDNLYVADEGSSAIEVFSSNGAEVRTIRGTFGKTRGAMIDMNGNLLVVDHENGVIQKLDPSGSRLAVWGNGTGGLTLSYPIEIGADGKGDLFVTDPGNLAIRKVAPDGTLLATWTASGKHHPIAIVVLPDGTTYTTEDDDSGKTARVVHRSPAGVELVAWI